MLFLFLFFFNPSLTFFFVQTAKIGSLVDIQDSEDPEGLRVFYYLVQDLKVRIAPYPFFFPTCCMKY
jgi:hypothetical protein